MSSDSSDSDSDSSSAEVQAKISLPGECNKYSQNVNVSKTVKDIESFCGFLRDNKVKDSKAAFLKLPYVVQCLFLQHSWEILTKKSKHSEDSYRTAFYLFKLFRSKELKAKPIYARYVKLKTTEKTYKKALDWSRSSPKKSRTGRSSSGPRKSAKYDKEYQKYVEPQSETDPLYIFYTTLLQEKPKSPLAVTWLTEHGVFDGDERKKLVKKYKKLSDKGKLIKLR